MTSTNDSLISKRKIDQKSYTTSEPNGATPGLKKITIITRKVPKLGDPIRDRFLQKLGIDPATTAAQQGETSNSPTDIGNSRFLLRDVEPFHEELKYRFYKNSDLNSFSEDNFDDDDDDDGDVTPEASLLSISATSVSSSACSEKSSSRRGNKGGITFSNAVMVLPIPMRTEYSERIRARLWSDGKEINDNAQRNAMEFMAEGWDWRSVLEDDDMLVCSVTGELIHPVHYGDETFI